jgi:hyperosmotically inducible protein
VKIRGRSTFSLHQVISSNPSHPTSSASHPTHEFKRGGDRRMKRFTVKALLAQFVLLGSLGMLWAQQDTSSQDQPAADNTKVNQRDRNKSEATADQQKETPADRQLTQQIRKALVKDKSLSTYGHNVKIVTQNGIVTLRGPVKSAEEKLAIEAKAAEIAGSDKVTSEIQVASK